MNDMWHVYNCSARLVSVLSLALLTACRMEGDHLLPEQIAQGTPDAGFEVSADSVLTTPTKGADPKLVRISLVITNLSHQQTRFSLINAIQLNLTELATGTRLFAEGGRDGTRAGTSLSGTVGPRERYEILIPARLGWNRDCTSLELTWKDGFGGSWSIQGLALGRYSIEMSYEVKSNIAGSKNPVWTGAAHAAPASVTIISGGS